MNEAARIIPIGHNRLDYLRRRIIEGHERANRGGAEWVEGSLQMAEALREGREAVPANISFREWLKQNNLDFLSHHDRAALINLGENLALARVVLTETDHKSYERIWAQNKSRFTSARKTPIKRKTRTTLPGQGMVNRIMKLGEETVAALKGTSLDSAMEMDELIMLNRGSPPGEHTEIVKRLIADAVAGKPVSAVAETRITLRSHNKSSSFDIEAAWIKRMVAPWTLADQDRRTKLLIYLSDDLDEDHQIKLATYLLDKPKGV